MMSLYSPNLSLSNSLSPTLEMKTQGKKKTAISDPLSFLSPAMSNSTSIYEEANVSSEAKLKKRSQPGNPDPDAEVIAMSPKTLMATHRFVCEVCSKGFQRDQNLQLHMRGHNLPWKLKLRSSEEAVRKRVYVCPEQSCVHHHPSRALGDLTGIKKHFYRKHGEKKWKCERCEKKYGVLSDWKVHVKTCGNKEYTCHCGAIFSRNDNFVTHRAYCDALAQETATLRAATAAQSSFQNTSFPTFGSLDPLANPNPNPNIYHPYPYMYPTISTTSPHLSATALLQKASTMGVIQCSNFGAGEFCHVGLTDFEVGDLSTWQQGDRLTRDFLRVVAGERGDEGMQSLTGLDLVTAPFSNCVPGGDHTKPHATFIFPPVSDTWGNC